MSDVSRGVGWWIASDGKWYPPELHPSQHEAAVAPAPIISYPAIPPFGAPPPSSGPSTPAGEPPFGVPGGAGGWPPWPGQQARSPMPYQVQKGGAGRRRRFIAAAIVLALVIVSVSLVAVLGSSAPAYPAQWNPRVLAIVHFVEQQRGLSFKHPVKVEFLDSAQFNQEVTVPEPSSASDRASETKALQELRAVGLVHGNVNLAQSENQLNQSSVVGLYVDTKKTVFVRGSSLTPFVRVTLAHELTHALQDQYFDLTRLRSDIPGDGSALTALIEGDAVRVQNAYEKTLSPSEQQAYEKASSKYDGSSKQSSDVPEFLSDVLSYPYAFGPTFIDNLVAQGGTGAIDNAFRHPPVAQAQIIDPVAYPVGWKPTKVPAPSVPHGDRVTDPASAFGQLTLFEVLGSRLGYAPAWNAVQGWQGDNSLAYRAGGKTCDAIAVEMRTSAQGGGLAGALRRWSGDAVALGATVRQTGRRVVLRSCDPGADGPSVPVMNPSAFDVLAARAELIDSIITEGHVDFALGACVSDDVIGFLGPSRYSELLANSLSPSQQSQLQQSVTNGAITCRSNGVS